MQQLSTFSEQSKQKRVENNISESSNFTVLLQCYSEFWWYILANVEKAAWRQSEEWSSLAKVIELQAHIDKCNNLFPPLFPPLFMKKNVFIICITKAQNVQFMPKSKHYMSKYLPECLTTVANLIHTLNWLEGRITRQKHT